MSAAIRMIGEGVNQIDACNATGVSLSMLSQRLDELECHHPKCTEFTPCRGAKRRKGGVMACLVLEDTVFDDVCPFYKTVDDFEEEEREYEKTAKRRQVFAASAAKARTRRAKAEQMGG